MVEAKKTDELEEEFGKLETELVGKIRVAHSQNLKEFPAGVCIEVASDEEKDFRLYIDSNGKWSVRYQMAGFEIEANPNLSRILDNFVFVTDKDYRGFNLEIREQRLQTNREKYTKDLMDKMQQTLTNLG